MQSLRKDSPWSPYHNPPPPPQGEPFPQLTPDPGRLKEATVPELQGYHYFLRGSGVHWVLGQKNWDILADKVHAPRQTLKLPPDYDYLIVAPRWQWPTIKQKLTSGAWSDSKLSSYAQIGNRDYLLVEDCQHLFRKNLWDRDSWWMAMPTGRLLIPKDNPWSCPHSIFWNYTATNDLENFSSSSLRRLAESMIKGRPPDKTLIDAVRDVWLSFMLTKQPMERVPRLQWELEATVKDHLGGRDEAIYALAWQMIELIGEQKYIKPIAKLALQLAATPHFLRNCLSALSRKSRRLPIVEGHLQRGALMALSTGKCHFVKIGEDTMFQWKIGQLYLHLSTDLEAFDKLSKDFLPPRELFPRSEQFWQAVNAEVKTTDTAPQHELRALWLRHYPDEETVLPLVAKQPEWAPLFSHYLARAGFEVPITPRQVELRLEQEGAKPHLQKILGHFKRLKGMQEVIRLRCIWKVNGSVRIGRFANACLAATSTDFRSVQVFLEMLSGNRRNTAVLEYLPLTFAKVSFEQLFSICKNVKRLYPDNPILVEILSRLIRLDPSFKPLRGLFLSDLNQKTRLAIEEQFPGYCVQCYRRDPGKLIKVPRLFLLAPDLDLFSEWVRTKQKRLIRAILDEASKDKDTREAYLRTAYNLALDWQDRPLLRLCLKWNQSRETPLQLCDLHHLDSFNHPGDQRLLLREVVLRASRDIWQVSTFRLYHRTGYPKKNNKEGVQQWLEVDLLLLTRWPRSDFDLGMVVQILESMVQLAPSHPLTLEAIDLIHERCVQEIGRCKPGQLYKTLPIYVRCLALTNSKHRESACFVQLLQEHNACDLEARWLPLQLKEPPVGENPLALIRQNPENLVYWEWATYEAVYRGKDLKAYFRLLFNCWPGRRFCINERRHIFILFLENFPVPDERIKAILFQWIDHAIENQYLFGTKERDRLRALVAPSLCTIL